MSPQVKWPSSLAALVGFAALLCTVPYFIQLHADSVPYRDFGFTLRIATVAFLGCNTVAGWTVLMWGGRTSCSVTGVCLTGGFLAVVYNLLFGVRSASIAVCAGTVARGCLEQDRSCAVTGSVRAWAGALYLCGLAAVVVSHSYLMLLMLLRIVDSTRPLRQLVTLEEKAGIEITGNATSFVETGPRLVVTSESVPTLSDRQEGLWTRK